MLGDLTETWSFGQAAGTLAAIFVIYQISQVIYRLFFSPIANFPGPKLAAATLWYEFYYDVIKQGRYEWKIKELHEQYGASLYSLSKFCYSNSNK
jgi:hypothetical protein